MAVAWVRTQPRIIGCIEDEGGRRVDDCGGLA